MKSQTTIKTPACLILWLVCCWTAIAAEGKDDNPNDQQSAPYKQMQLADQQYVNKTVVGFEKQCSDALRLIKFSLDLRSNNIECKLPLKYNPVFNITLLKNICEILVGLEQSQQPGIGKYLEKLKLTIPIGSNKYTLYYNGTKSQPGNSCIWGIIGEQGISETHANYYEIFEALSKKPGLPTISNMLQKMRNGGGHITTYAVVSVKFDGRFMKHNLSISQFLNGFNLLLDFEIARRLVNGDKYGELPIVSCVNFLLNNFTLNNLKHYLTLSQGNSVFSGNQREEFINNTIVPLVIASNSGGGVKVKKFDKVPAKEKKSSDSDPDDDSQASDSGGSIKEKSKEAPKVSAKAKKPTASDPGKSGKGRPKKPAKAAVQEKEPTTSDSGDNSLASDSGESIKEKSKEAPKVSAKAKKPTASDPRKSGKGKSKKSAKASAKEKEPAASDSGGYSPASD